MGGRGTFAAGNSIAYTYDERFSKNATGAFTRSPAKLLLDEMKKKYKKYFRGIKL